MAAAAVDKITEATMGAITRATMGETRTMEGECSRVETEMELLALNRVLLLYQNNTG